MKAHFGEYKDFNNLALHLATNYNRYEPFCDPGKDTKLQYKDAIHIIIVYGYNWCVQYLCGWGIHKEHCQALAMSFLEIAQFFGRQFHDEKMTNKRHRQFDDALSQKNSAGKKDVMTELLAVKEGIFGHFFMDTNILSTLYYEIHNQQWPIGDMPQVPQHTTVLMWKKTINKFVDKTYDI